MTQRGQPEANKWIQPDEMDHAVAACAGASYAISPYQPADAASALMLDIGWI